ncbi:MAG: YitT family protein, partial [Clostridia bacterium]
MKSVQRILKNEMVAAYVQIIIGSVLGALAYPMFLVPNHIAPGGLTGLATVLNFLFKVPVGMTSLLLNIPLFILGYRSMGRVFA